MDEARKKNARRAVAIATAAYTNDKKSAGAAALELFRQFQEEDPDFEVNVIMGFTNIVTYLLVQMEEETGRKPEDVLAHLGRLFAEDPGDNEGGP